MDEEMENRQNNDIAEIVDLLPVEVSAVGRPATGRKFLIIKSAEVEMARKKDEKELKKAQGTEEGVLEEEAQEEAAEEAAVDVEAAAEESAEGADAGNGGETAAEEVAATEGEGGEGEAAGEVAKSSADEAFVRQVAILAKALQDFLSQVGAESLEEKARRAKAKKPEGYEYGYPSAYEYEYPKPKAKKALDLETLKATLEESLKPVVEALAKVEARLEELATTKATHKDKEEDMSAEEEAKAAPEAEEGEVEKETDGGRDELVKSVEVLTDRISKLIEAMEKPAGRRGFIATSEVQKGAGPTDVRQQLRHTLEQMITGAGGS